MYKKKLTAGKTLQDIFFSDPHEKPSSQAKVKGLRFVYSMIVGSLKIYH